MCQGATLSRWFLAGWQAARHTMRRQLRRMLPVWWILPTLQVYPAKVCTRGCMKGQSLNLIHPTYGMQPIRYSTNRTWLRLAPDGHLVAIQTFYSRRRRHRQIHMQTQRRDIRRSMMEYEIAIQNTWRLFFSAQFLNLGCNVLYTLSHIYGAHAVKSECDIPCAVQASTLIFMDQLRSAFKAIPASNWWPLQGWLNFVSCGLGTNYSAPPRTGTQLNFFVSLPVLRW